MEEQLYTEEYIYDEGALRVQVVETVDTSTNQSIFIAMSDDTSEFIGKGSNYEEAIVNLEEQMLEVDEFDDGPWELKLAS